MEKKEFTAVIIDYTDAGFKFGMQLDDTLKIVIINDITHHAYDAIPAFDLKNIGPTAHLNPNHIFKSLGIEKYDVPYMIEDLYAMRRKNINFPKDGIPVVVLMTYSKNKNLGSFRFPGRITMAGTIYDTYEMDKYFDISMYNQITKLFEEEGK